jgi:hypothetical protein
MLQQRKNRQVAHAHDFERDHFLNWPG